MPLKPKHPAARHLGPPLVRCREYLAFVRRQPCLVCGAYGVQAHHWGPHGLSVKAPDWLAIPLCADCHRQWHEAPWATKVVVRLVPRRSSGARDVAEAQRDMLVAWLMEQEASQPEGF